MDDEVNEELQYVKAGAYLPDRVIVALPGNVDNRPLFVYRAGMFNTNIEPESLFRKGKLKVVIAGDYVTGNPADMTKFYQAALSIDAGLLVVDSLEEYIMVDNDKALTIEELRVGSKAYLPIWGGVTNGVASGVEDYEYVEVTVLKVAEKKVKIDVRGDEKWVYPKVLRR